MEKAFQTGEDEMENSGTSEYLAAVGATSLGLVNEKLGFKYGPQNTPEEKVAKMMFRDIEKFMHKGNADWGEDVLAKTGLPGTKVVVDGMTVYFHGISHGQGNAIDKGVGREGFDDFLKKWVHDTYFDKKEGIVLESGFRQAYHMNQGEPAGEGSVMDNLFKESLGSVLKEAGIAMFLSAAMTFVRRNKEVGSAMPVFLQKLIYARKSIEDLIELRKSYFKLPQPFLTLLLAGLAPTHAVEKSIVMYRLGMDRMRGETVIHFLCGLDHEPQMATLARMEGISRASKGMYTRKGLEREGKQLVERMTED